MLEKKAAELERKVNAQGRDDCFDHTLKAGINFNLGLFFLPFKRFFVLKVLYQKLSVIQKILLKNCNMQMELVFQSSSEVFVHGLF